MPICKFCKQQDSVDKSHIIPEFMYSHTYDEKHKMVIADDALDEIGERQKGYYEPILCIDCENYFNKNFEQPCLGFVKNIPSHASKGSTVSFRATPTLELLLLSIIWRASNATGEHWRGVKLGPHQDIIKACLETKNPNSNYLFWLYLAANPDGEIEKGIVSSIQEVKVKGHSLYHFIASGVQYIIKISSHRFEKSVQPEPINFDSDMKVKVYDLRHVPSMHVIFKK